MTQNLLELETHFSFGENWAQYARKIDERRIEEAEKSLVRLVGREAIQGRTFLDIGCGSGLFSVAALRLGCQRLLAVDLDPRCVETTRGMLQFHAARARWECRCVSVFELDPANVGTFDVVYSWGVLHHTGAMHKAIGVASKLVASGGLLALGLYGKTPFCGLWRIEKRIYSRAAGWVQTAIRGAYLSLFRLRLALKGESFRKHRENYYQQRGMDLYHDMHDWLGGYPYESISPREAVRYLRELGFEPVRSFVYPCIGLLGAGCDEYCFTKPLPKSSSAALLAGASGLKVV
ncbi:MAG: class I SAM-dependent methyltransferase [Acidobacteria bacterium]|nr:class I SAM-dependent methyltransferase [Acidobacteriota bacterium]